MGKETAAKPIRYSRLPPKNKKSWNLRGKKQQESNEVKRNDSKNRSKKAKKTNKSNKKEQWQLKRKKEGRQKKKEMKGVLDPSAGKTEPAAAVHVRTYQCWQVLGFQQVQVSS
jgi:hypothetical protein